MAKPATLATSVVTSPSSAHLNVSLGTGHYVVCENHDNVLVRMTKVAIVLSFTATGAHKIFTQLAFY